MRNTRALAQIVLGMLAFYGFPTIPAAAQDRLDRTVLPIQEPKPPLYTELDARNATPPARFQVKAPDGAPNVLIVLIDDMGFGQSSAFGGPVHMPTIEALASEGLRFNQFHTTALCSPTRTALLSGRNHHMNNMGGITEIATAFPGNTGQVPASVASVAEMLRLNGYSTSQRSRCLAPNRHVSIHAPARGATLRRSHSALAANVSIHAPARGATMHTSNVPPV
jgi:Sulfatase